MRRAVLAIMASLLLVFAVAPGAEAETGYGTVTSRSGVLYNGCHYHPYAYSLSVPAGTQYWNLTVSLVGPDGIESTSDYLAQSLGDPMAGTGGLQVCGFELAGVYSLRSVLEYEDSGWNTHTVPLPTTYVALRKPYSRTTVKMIKTRPGKHKMRISSSDERPAGYFGAAYATVYLQQRVDGRWVKVRGTRTTTNETGVARFWVGHNHKRYVKVRAVTVRSTSFSGSYSPAIRFR